MCFQRSYIFHHDFSAETLLYLLNHTDTLTPQSSADTWSCIVIALDLQENCLLTIRFPLKTRWCV